MGFKSIGFGIQIVYGEGGEKFKKSGRGQTPLMTRLMI